MSQTAPSRPVPRRRCNMRRAELAIIAQRPRFACHVEGVTGSSVAIARIASPSRHRPGLGCEDWRCVERLARILSVTVRSFILCISTVNVFVNGIGPGADLENVVLPNWLVLQIIVIICVIGSRHVGQGLAAVVVPIDGKGASSVVHHSVAADFTDGRE